MTITGALRSIKSRVDASGDVTNVVVFETSEDVSKALGFMGVTLVMTLDVESK